MAKRKKTVRDVKMGAKAGKDNDAAATMKPRKAPGRTMRQAAGMRASMNTGGKKRTTG